MASGGINMARFFGWLSAKYAILPQEQSGCPEREAYSAAFGRRRQCIKML